MNTWKLIRHQFVLARRRLFDKSYKQKGREVERLKRLPRYQPTVTNLIGEPLHIIDAASFLSSYHQIFEREIYRFEPQDGEPTIIDCGANIGQSVFYWKHLFPKSRIIAFEPSPSAFFSLRQNCEENNLEKVKLIQSAVWINDDKLPFWEEGADAGRINTSHTSGSEEMIVVSAIRLKDFLNQPIDLLKLDVEGAEVELLIDCRDSLDQIDRIFVEYHSFVDQDQRLDEILKILRHAGFRIHIHPELVVNKPFLQETSSIGMDQRLNIFAFRS